MWYKWNLRSRGTSRAEDMWLMSVNSTAPKLSTHFLFLSMAGWEKENQEGQSGERSGSTLQKENKNNIKGCF